MNVQGNFIMKSQQELQTKMVVNEQPYEFVIKATKDPQKNWKLDITLSSANLTEKKTHSITLSSLVQNSAVIGIGLDKAYHRSNEQLVDFSQDLDPEVAQEIKKLGESILLTITRHGSNLTYSLEEAKEGIVKDV